MDIQARYRDVPLQEVRKCAPDYPAEQWASQRGRPVQLIQRSIDDEYQHCSGVKFKTAECDAEGRHFWACEHILDMTVGEAGG